MAAKLGFLAGLFLVSIAEPHAVAQIVPCGPAWQPTFGHGPGIVESIVGHDDGSGPALFAAGRFPTPSGVKRLGRWDGAAWSWIGDFMPGPGYFDGNSWYYPLDVARLAEFDSGSGPVLYAAGNFSLLTGTTWATFIAKWNGSQWADLQGGMAGGYPRYWYYGFGGYGVYYETQVNALIVYDDGSGAALYVGGDFTQAGTVAAFFVARWNGITWSALGNGLNGPPSDFAEYDDGSGPALCVCGWFTGAGGVPALGVAKWNGSSWSGLGSGLGTGGGGGVECLAAFDDGSGPALYAGGRFSVAGSPVSCRVAKWNGSSWSSIANWIDLNDRVTMLEMLDDGTGPALFVGGRFTPFGGGPRKYFLRWDGSTWSSLGSGLTGLPFAMTAYDIGSGPALYVGGSIHSLDSGDTFLARWATPPGCGSTGFVICEPGTGGVMPCPCSNPPGGPGRGCNNSASTGGAHLDISGTASLANDSVVFATTGELPFATSIVLQGDALNATGITFGQGVRCTAGSLKRLYVKSAIVGWILAPDVGDASVSARSAALGDAIPPGFTRYYGVYYRELALLGGCPASSPFNVTQQLSVLWNP